MLFYDEEFPNELVEVDHELLEKIERCGIRHTFKKSRVVNLQNVLASIFDRMNSGYKIFSLENGQIVKNNRQPILYDLEIPWCDVEFDDETSKEGNLIISMDVIAKNEEHAIEEFNRICKIYNMDDFKTLEDWSMHYYEQKFKNCEEFSSCC